MRDQSEVDTSNVVESNECKSRGACWLLKVYFSNSAILVKEVVELSLSNVDWKISNVYSGHRDVCVVRKIVLDQY